MNAKFFIIALLSFTIHSQVDNPNINVKSPGVADFIKYGNVSSMSNIGELKLDIPILSMPIVGGNPLNVSLSYAATGFRPGKRSGLVGYNWFLNIGGVITRQINSVPDDQRGHWPAWISDTNYADGFIIGVTHKTHNPTDVFNLASGTSFNANGALFLYGNSNSNQLDNNNYEPDPDIFNFNFNGISGSFFMGNDGLIKVNNSSPNVLKIDISQLAFQEDTNSTFCLPKPSKILIIDDKGNKYHFGGELKNLEYSLSGHLNGSDFISENKPIINSWFLYKIEYYMGTTVNFNYRDDSNLSQNFANEHIAQHGELNGTNDYLRDFIVFNENFQRDDSINSDSNVVIAKGSNIPTYNVQKIAILDEIISDDFKVNFSYSRQPNVFNNRDSETDYEPSHFCMSLYNQFTDIKLDNIQLLDNSNNVINNFTFSYDFLGGTINSRMFLNSITESGKPPHSFEYFPTGILPKPITFSIDHWGFWNGKNNNNSSYLIPQVNYDFPTGNYTYINDASGQSRNPDFNFALKGQLKKVTYPTKGYSEFEYEPHNYSKRLDIKTDNNFIPDIYDVNDIAGGVRISKIHDFDGISTSNSKEYKYISDYAANYGNVSSGILLKWPRYHSYFLASQITSSDNEYYYKRSNPIGNVIIDSPIISYSEVTEVLINNSFKVNKYSDFISNPDLPDFVSEYNPALFGQCVPDGIAANYIGELSNNRGLERGKILSEAIYDINSQLKQFTTFVYNTTATKFNNFSTRMHTSGNIYATNKIYHYNDYLTQKKTFIYNSANQIVTTENFIYEPAISYHTNMTSQDVLTKKNSSTSYNNEFIETHYKYPWNIYLPSNTNFLNFKNENISVPIDEIQLKNSIKLFEKFSFFEKNETTNNLLLPKNIYFAKFPNNFPSILNIGNLEKKITYNMYDSKGNILEYTPENGIPVSIIYGHSKTLPIAKIENATNAQVQAALGINFADVTEANMSTINALRSSLPNSMVTTYTYIPLVGVSTITDPKGDTITYIYDSFNRLKEVKDKNSNILSQNQYHYKN